MPRRPSTARGLRPALGAVLLVASLAPARADAGFEACIWGALKQERSSPIRFQWRFCQDDPKPGTCSDWNDTDVVSARDNALGTRTIEHSWKDDYFSRRPNIRDIKGHFDIRYDDGAVPGSSDQIYRRIEADFIEKTVTDLCSGKPSESYFAVTPKGIDLRKGCHPKASECRK